MSNDDASNRKQDPTLSEVIGALVASVAHARSVADVEALRIAQRYFQSPLLRGMPVPRLRLSRVDINFPIILSDIVPGSSPEPESSDNIAQAVLEALNESASAALNAQQEPAATQGAASGPAAPPSDLLPFDRSIQQIADRILALCQLPVIPPEYELLKPLQRQIGQALMDFHHANQRTVAADTEISSHIGEVTENALREWVLRVAHTEYQLSHRPPLPDDATPEEENAEAERLERDTARARTAVSNEARVVALIRDGRRAAEQRAVKNPSIPPEIRVSVHTDAIKNQGGGPNVVTRLSMSLLEEGLEWVGQPGGQDWKLTQE